MPVGLLVLVAASLVVQPFGNLLTRRMEMEADWVALETTRDPDAARELFVHFTEFALAYLSPARVGVRPVRTTAPHPSMLDRIRMAEAWRARSEGRSHP